MNRNNRRRAKRFWSVGLCMIWAAVIICGSGIWPPASLAADGDLDLSFGDKGRVVTRVDYGYAMMAMALQPDGKILAATAVGNDFFIIRYTGGGQIDNSFGQSGRVLTNFSQTSAPDYGYPGGLVVQPDGKIILVGYSRIPDKDYDFAIVRYQSDGSLDSSFGDGGKILTDFLGGDDIAGAVALMPDGRIMVAGGALIPHTSVSKIALARYTVDGHPDASFGIDGKMLTDFSGYSSGAVAIAFTGDSKLIVAGTTADNDSHSHFALRQYNADGSLDVTFGNNGTVVSNFEAYCVGMAVQPDGKMVLAGTIPLDFNLDRSFTIARFNIDGTLDVGFGNGGQAFARYTALQEGRTIALSPDGQIIIAGRSPYIKHRFYDFVILRYNSDGSPDSHFGNGGEVTADFFHGLDVAELALVLPDGRILIGGNFDGEEQGTGFALVRYDGGFPRPQILNVTVDGKALLVNGGNFNNGARLLLNGEEQKTKNDSSQPGTVLIAKKAGKKIHPGDKLRVRNSDGKLSDEFIYAPPAQ